jgi:hypothetical protein
MAKLNKHTIPLTDSKELEVALKKTRDKKLAQMIRAELRSRESMGVDRPLTIEDYLG